MRLAVAVGLIMLWLTACTITPRKSFDEDLVVQQRAMRLLQYADCWEMQGKISVRSSRGGYHGSFEWSHQAASDLIRFRNPFGHAVATVHVDQQHVIYQDAEQRIVEENVESLLAKTLNINMPIENIADWMLGLPATADYRKLSLDEQHLPVHINESGWTVDWSRYAAYQGVMLPGALRIERGQDKTRLIITERLFCNDE